MSNKRLMHITTVPMSLAFLRGQVGYMKQRGLEVGAISSPGEELAAFGRGEGVATQAVPMSRRISPLADLLAVVRLVRQIGRWRPDIVHAHTPKGGLLGMIAAWLARTPVRVYHLRGLPFVTAGGVKAWLLRQTEKVSCALAHRVICVSHSVREIVVSEGLCPAEKITVLAGGSGNGVDAAERFNPGRLSPLTRQGVRRQWGIPDDALVVGFVGRIVQDKGVVELAEALRRIRQDVPDVHLLMVGPGEERDPVPAAVLEYLRTDAQIHLTGNDWDTPRLYAAMDAVALPTYREGFPNVPLEAAAMGLPVVATRVPGCVDAIEDGVTGTLVPPRDAEALAIAIQRYLMDSELRRRHGSAGRERVLREFRPEAIWEALHAEYTSLLNQRLWSRRGTSHLTGRLLKRGIDFGLALVGFVLLGPVMLIVALAVRLHLGSPILFRQLRPGYKGRPFTLLKFRTMRDDAGPDGKTLADGRRLTWFGRLLRSTSLDELPQLWNVLRGDMSLIGPRPLLMEYLPLYSPQQARRHEVRPGITGWAQVNGRNALSWPEKFALDVWYVDNQSLWLDLKILFLTGLKVFRREGVSQAGSATMERFRGGMGITSPASAACDRKEDRAMTTSPSTAGV